MDSVHHIWCPLSSQEYQDLPDGAETTLTNVTGYTCSNQRWSDGRNVRWIKTRQFHESGQTPKAPGRGIEKIAK
ncbi:hypothetical protein CF638_27005 [Klebsiella pneumoniae]|nr:hypothetical protein [Klebsiella pneumoniae]